MKKSRGAGKVLLVSSHPLSPTGRGMDVLSYTFAHLGWDVTHLQFPVYPYSNTNNMQDSGITRLKGKMNYLPYVDSLMWWLPGFLFRLIARYSASRTGNIDFSQYRYIVLESGKSLFLLPRIPSSVKIIYRQSDVLGRGRHYCALEDEVSRRACSIILVKDYYRQSILPEYRHKTTVIRNGFNLPAKVETENPYRQPLNAVYVGLTPLNPQTLSALCSAFPDLHVHIFGSCIRSRRVQRSLKRKHSNFHFYGFRPPSEYLPCLQHATLAVFPFKDWGGMAHVGFTSKFFNYMYFSLPIVTYRTGDPEEFKPYGIVPAGDQEAFIRQVGEILKNPAPREYKVDWEFFSPAGRRRAYEEYIQNLVKNTPVKVADR